MKKNKMRVFGIAALLLAASIGSSSAADSAESGNAVESANAPGTPSAAEAAPAPSAAEEAAKKAAEEAAARKAAEEAAAAAKAAQIQKRLQTDKALTGHRTPDFFTQLNPRNNFNRAPGGQNFLTVIPGLLYRGGSGTNAGLNQTQLQLFCSQGFSNASFVYEGGNLGRVSCEGNSYSYEYANPNDGDSTYRFLSRVAAAVKQDKGPVYVHCWRGHHQSGQMAAYALQLFCGYNADQASRYWDQTSNGDGDIGVSVKRRIRWFDGQKKTQRFVDLTQGVDISSLCPGQ